jgi:hypothetical protein
MKTHFATVDYGNESNSSDEWSEPLCNTYSENVSNDWDLITCKKCLKRKTAFEEQMKRVIENF